MLTQQRLKELFSYDPYTGLFTRLLRTSVVGKVGSVAGWDKGNGYIVIFIDGKNYKSHRLAYLYMTGYWPKDQVDHIDGIRSNNRWSNLRDVSSQENTHNQRNPHKNNSTGFLGVKPARRKFLAHIRLNGNIINVGSFDSAEKAHLAYLKAKRELHPTCTI